MKLIKERKILQKNTGSVQNVKAYFLIGKGVLQIKYSIYGDYGTREFGVVD